EHLLRQPDGLHEGGSTSIDRCSPSGAPRQPGVTAKATTNSETSCAPDPACANTFLRRRDAFVTCFERRSHFSAAAAPRTAPGRATPRRQRRPEGSAPRPAV